MSDELNDAARGLIASARRTARTLEPDRRARLRIAVMGAAGASSAAAAASLTVTKLVIVGALSAAVGSGTTLWVVRNVERTQTSPVRATPRAQPLAVAPVPASALEASRSAEVTELQPPPPAEEKPRPRPPPPAAPIAAAPERAEAPEPPAEQPQAAPSAPPPPPSAALLAEELEVLDRALQATREKRWGEAQRILDEHDRRFLPAALGAEARVLQVVVLCGLDRHDDARALALELERIDPLNPAVQRLQGTCVGHPP